MVPLMKIADKSGNKGEACQGELSLLVAFFECIGKRIDILISKNQALQILYLKHYVYNETT